MSTAPQAAPRSGGLLGSAAVVVLVALLLAWSVVDEWRFASQRIGVLISQDEQGVLIEDVEPDSPAERAGLQSGDRVISLEGRAFSTLEELDELFDRHQQPGGVLRGEVARDGRTLPIELEPGVPIDLAGLLAKFVLVAAYLGLAALASRYRRQDPRARILTLFVALVAVELALPAGYTLGELAVTGTLLFWLLSTGVQFAMELHLVSLIPKRLPLLQKRPRLVWVYYVIGFGSGFLLASAAVYQWYLAPPDGPPLLMWTETAVLVSWAVSVAGILAWQAWRAESARETNQALMVLAGLLPWAVYIVVSSVWPGWSRIDPALAEHIENVILLIFPATVFLAIFRYGLFDVESLVRRGLVYGAVALLVIILLYTLLTTALPLFEQAFGLRTSQWIVTACALIIGILFRPLRRGIERLVERGLFPKRRALRHRLIQVARALSTQGRLETLVQQLADESRQALDLSWSAVVAVDEAQDGLTTAFSRGIEADRRERLTSLLHERSRAFGHLERLRRPVTVNRLRRQDEQSAEELAAIGAEVLVPLYFQRRMIGTLCLGRKHNGELFRREEIELLDLFSHQVATSLENLRLFQDATYEELTGLLRREVVLRQLDTEAARAVRRGTPLSVCMIDLDHFKSVNDAHGHLFGDRILSRVAGVMRERVRAVDAIGRYGGEEFLLVLPETDDEGARRLAEELRQAVADLAFEKPDGSGTLGVTISIGTTTSASGKDAPERLAARLLQRADEAVYRAKSGGRNRIIALP
ncbi:diguanylate cyclase [Wenzhouxiangella sediminis]|uniref:diguanylate cyclase n=1 Tax=Wenzhouxiangella sediminis TaxID=1792836 RepID=A0A3E1KD20_9GAMM|nr:diguanylate cyclase [Wenzhouxiangella sediminis]RFF32225.1 diguanylate cyclase [Wenzhouxiangella sediminis]